MIVIMLLGFAAQSAEASAALNIKAFWISLFIDPPALCVRGSNLGELHEELNRLRLNLK